MAASDEQIHATIASLLEDRVPPATICPSEVARALAPDAWRPLMQRVRAAALDMARAGALEIRQRGHAIDPDGSVRGPIRLGRPVATPGPPTTPDGRYFVVRGRLWRKANPLLAPAERDALVRQLMDARRALRGSRPEEERSAARAEVDRAKRALGERGPVWWSDGAPDFNRKLAKNTPYREWFERLSPGAASPKPPPHRSRRPVPR